MRVCAVSPWETTSANDILSFLAAATAELIVLLGNSKSGNTPSPEEVQRIILPGVAVFVEYGGSKGKATPYLVTSEGARPRPRGIFPRSPTAKCMEELEEAWRDRKFHIGSRTVTFAICGEINGFNPDGSVKYGRKLPFDILANPAHTVMGRWYILVPKLSALSKGNVVIHVANNNRKHPERSKTDVRIYLNEMLQDDKVQCGEKLKWV